MTTRHMTEAERMQRHETLMRDHTLQQIRSVEDWCQTMTVLGESKDEIHNRLTILEEAVQRIRERYR